MFVTLKGKRSPKRPYLSAINYLLRIGYNIIPKRSRSMGNVGRLILAQKINAEYMTDGSIGLLVHGRQRIGKSSYTQRCLAESYGVWEKQAVCPIFEERKRN